MAADIKPFQTILTPSPIKDESILGRIFNLAEKYKFTKEEMDAHEMPDIKSAREMAVFQMQLLTMMQVCCIEAESDDSRSVERQGA